MDSYKKVYPYCGEEIMAAVKKCRHCGEWLDDSKSHRLNPDKQPSKYSHKNKILIIGGVVVAIIGMATIVFSFGSDSKPSLNAASPADYGMIDENKCH